MKLINKPGGDFAPAPMGLHRAVCVDWVDLGILPGFSGKPQHKLYATFELPDSRMEDGRPFVVSRRFTASLHEASQLAQFLAKWRGGIPFKQGEELDLETLIGKPALVVVTHAERDGRKYANIDSILPCAEQVRPSGHYKRKEAQPQKQSGSAVQRPVPPQVQPRMEPATAGRTAFPSPGPLPTTAELINVPPTSRADEQFREGALGITGKPATGEQKQKFLGILLPIRESAAKYFNSLGALGNDQTLDQLPLQYCPATKVQFDNVMASIQTFIDAQPAADDQSVPF